MTEAAQQHQISRSTPKHTQCVYAKAAPSRSVWQSVILLDHVQCIHIGAQCNTEQSVVILQHAPLPLAAPNDVRHNRRRYTLLVREALKRIEMCTDARGRLRLSDA